MNPLAAIILCLLVVVKGAPSKENIVFSVSVLSDDGEIQLNLRRSETSVFHEEFRVFLSSSGGQPLQDVTPTQNELSRIEDQIHVDPVANAVVSLKYVNDQPRLFGQLNDRLITHTGNGVHTVANPIQEDLKFDHVEIPFEGPTIHVNRSADAVVSPELFIVADFNIYTRFGGSVAAITEYFAILVRSVNGRYATSTDPSVTIRVAGLLLMQNSASQPFIEDHRNPDGTYALSPILPAFAQYMQNLGGIPGYDVAALMMDLQSESTVAGIAYLSAACRSTAKYSINLDKGGVFAGIRVFVHELGHNLGSPHDGDVNSGTTDCPNSDGYIMNTSGGSGTENQFYFSSCSKAKMNEYFGTTAANCLYSNEAPVTWTPSPLLPGDKIDMLAVCQNYRADAYVSDTHSPDELCVNLRCKYRAPCPPPDENQTCIWTATLGTSSPDGASCGSGGKCSTGRCQN